MHERPNLPFNPTQLQSYTSAREMKVCVCVVNARLSICERVFVFISELEGLFLFSGLSLCQHITVHACPNQSVTTQIQLLLPLLLFPPLLTQNTVNLCVNSSSMKTNNGHAIRIYLWKQVYNVDKVFLLTNKKRNIMFRIDSKYCFYDYYIMYYFSMTDWKKKKYLHSSRWQYLGLWINKSSATLTPNLLSTDGLFFNFSLCLSRNG